MKATSFEIDHDNVEIHVHIDQAVIKCCFNLKYESQRASFRRVFWSLSEKYGTENIEIVEAQVHLRQLSDHRLQALLLLALREEAATERALDSLGSMPDQPRSE